MREKENIALPSDMVIHLLLDLAPHTRISKHIPGKITIQFSFSALGILKNANLKNIGYPVPGIRKTRTSLWKRSMVIEYDENRIPFNIWEDLLRYDHDPAQRIIVTTQLRKILDRSNL